MILGMNLSHDSSISIHDEGGEILFAAQEERFKRIKNYSGFPKCALQQAIKIYPEILNCGFSRVVIGSHRDPNEWRPSYWVNLLDSDDVNWDNNPFRTKPGNFHRVKSLNSEFNNNREILEYLLTSKANNLGIQLGRIEYVSHEDAHSASGIVGSGFENGLGFSLDGSGDNESGVIQVFDRKNISDLARIPATHSLGLVYSAVTSKYGFRSNRHEGKITGLAAQGSTSLAVEYLLDHIRVQNGIPHIGIVRTKLSYLLNRLFSRISPTVKKIPISIENLVDEASSRTTNYPDLAFAIQFIVEETILEMVKFWLKQTGRTHLTLAGGVFSNVRINQILAEHSGAESVYIFPNMGDAGLAPGGVWRKLLDSGNLSRNSCNPTMYLGNDVEECQIPEDITAIKLKEKDLYEVSANLIYQGFILGTCFGNMEFGPRALCNRSILASPFDSTINQSLNKRLRRTEFMPFAPVVLKDFAQQIFEIENFGSLVPFQFMTMTCRVRESWRFRIPAIVHVDGTARPQLLEYRHNPSAYQLLRAFYNLTACPVMINTSFNAHEEPIVSSLNDAIRSLQSGNVDAVLSKDSLLVRNNDKLLEAINQLKPR